MELFIAGGVGEHGRNCFCVKGETVQFLVDCGKMADAPENPYPHLSAEQIQGLDAVFLTHSHNDHTGALPWLYKNGFTGTVFATEETLRQLPFSLPRSLSLERLCPNGAGRLNSLSIFWGRSGHCVGSVWYRFTERERIILFSGDYTEDTQVYACDLIRNQRAELAVLDCAYGTDETPYAEACDRLACETDRLLSAHKLLLFPVPKYGRGVEILRLLSDRLSGVHFYGDALFAENLAVQKAGGFWYRSEAIDVAVPVYSGQMQGIVFVSDPQMRSEAAQKTAERVLSLGGRAVMTGTLERDSYSGALCRQGKMELLRYPVHLNRAQFEQLVERNHFAQTVAYHSASFSAPQTISVGALPRR